ncbi:MAG: Tol-Pal system beta propeller repeat protein TolB [Chlorobiaceae bacterium]
MQLFRYVVAAVMIFLCFSLPLLAAEGGEYIAIRKEGSGKIALALDKLNAPVKEESRLAQSLDTIIRDGLDFTGLFTMISPPLNVKDNSSRDNVVLNFGALDSVGAAVYAGGAVTNTSGSISLNMQVYDTSGAKLLLKKTYNGKQQQLRTIGHAFCADLVELLTGKKSIFGSKIVFISNKTGFKEIYECDFDGHELRQLTNSHSISLTPVLSPDGRYLAYTGFSSGRPALYIRNLSDGKTLAVGKSGISIDPGWRNSRELATTLSFEGDQEIYLIKADGAISRRLTFSKGIDLSPSFSPDGNKMAYVSDQNGLPQIFIEDLQSGQVNRLTFSGRYNTQPSWSPAGDKIAYTTWGNGGEIDIFTVNIDGSGLKQLTGNSGENESPSWSSDGRMIVFASNRKGSKKLYIMGSTGDSQRPLLQSDGEQMQPCWSLFSQ